MAMAAASAGDVDRISALPDDLLRHILGLVSDAKSVVRTAALSWRWRRVWWIYTQQLVLSDTQVRSGADPGQLVDWVLAQRGDADDIESLDISMSRSSLVDISQEKVNDWLRYAMQHVVKSFRLDLPNHRATWSPLRVDELAAVVLPDRGRMTSISMFLTSCYRFQLPVATSAKYEALTELTLYSASFFDDDGESSGGGRALGDFVSSSCCPSLRELEISGLEGLAQLAIRSETLETFKLRFPKDLRVVDVTVPNLRVLELDLDFGFGDGSNDDEHSTFRIASSRLQEIAIWQYSWRRRRRRRRPDLKIRDLRSVCRLTSVHLDMHGGQYYIPSTDIGFRLLKKCPSVEHVGVWLHHQPYPSSAIEGHVIADLTLEDAAPFASVRSMDIMVSAHEFPDGHLVPSIFALLLRCPCLRSLHIWIFDDTASWATSWGHRCFCDEQYAWTDHQAIALESLEDVKIIGFGGADEDMDLVRLLFASAKNSIKSMTLDNITKTPGTVSLNRIMAEDDDVTETTIEQKLMDIPIVDRGRWQFFGDITYTWTLGTTGEDADLFAWT